MVNITDWGDFRLGDLFSEIYKAEAHVKTDLTECVHSDARAIPFISRTENDNGCDCFVENDGTISGIEKGNVIIIGDTTSTFFYQRDSFVAGDLKKSLAGQFKLNPIRLQMDKSSFPVATKDYANLLGLELGAPYLPTKNSTEQQLEGLRKQLVAAGLL